MGAWSEWFSWGGSKDLMQEKSEEVYVIMGYWAAILLIMPFALFLATTISLLFGQPIEHFSLSPEFTLIGGEAIIILIVLFHFMLNLFSVLFQTEQFTKCIITIILSVISAIVVWKNKSFFYEKENEA